MGMTKRSAIAERNTARIWLMQLKFGIQTKMWERACSRMQWISQLMYWLTLRIREQARSHI
ncbi:hypothetical protein AU074_16935 [Pseudomonas sp. ATCC PTA-122608]|nr:hypothetical protein AU074_16935 [Pseudomonas sp. ATCC PTA-122608]